MGEARILIQDELQQTASMISGAAGAAAAPAMTEERSRAAALLPWIWAAAATVLLAVVAISWGSSGDVGTGLTRLEVKISDQDPLYADLSSAIVISPDGRWVTYHSNETGRAEVFVRPFPARGGKWQISVDGGTYPRWSRDGRKLYYRLDNALYEVDVDGQGSSFRAETPLKLIEGPFLSLSLGGLTLADYDVHPDGERFVMMQEDPSSTPIQATHAVFVFDWFSELDRLTPER